MSPTSPLFPLLSILILQATATWTAYEEYVSGLSKHSTSYPSKRPLVEFSPNQPWKTFPSSPPRHKICHVPSHNDFTTDDSSYILSALQECNNGGRVVFPSNTSYVIGTALDLTFLHHIDLDIQAYIQFTNDTDYWQSHGFHHIFQNATTFFQLGGSDVNVYGGGMLDGNGQVWYDLYASNKLILRPILFGIIGLHSGVIADLRLRYSPQWYNLIANSSDLVFDGIDIAGYSRSENMAKNTDGFDTYRSENVVIQNCVVNNGDDCVSFKPNSTEILVQNLWCNGSHGISVGSLGQYPGEVDIVENVYVYNISMFNASNGARIKVWPGVNSAKSVDLQGGGGLGRVSNITYQDMRIENVNYAIEVTQCYGQKNLTLCNQFPSKLAIDGITFNNIHGTTSKKYSPVSGYILCSSPQVCSDIEVNDIKVVSTDGTTNLFTCGNVDASLLHGITCTSKNRGSS